MNCKKCLVDNKNVIECLQSEMLKNKYISKEAIVAISKKTNTSVCEVYSTATFYSGFKLKKEANCVIEVCTGTSCFILGAEKIIELIKNKLKIDINEETNDKKFALREVRCLGCCSIAPVVRINGKIFDKVSASKMLNILISYGYKENMYE